jgi:SagB-type dehydrogenase family enzyme
MSTPLDALSYSMVDFFEEDDTADSYVFHESTKVTRRNYGELSRRNESMIRDPQFLLMSSRAWKRYDGAEKQPLPVPSLDDVSLGDAIRRRKSQIGAYSGASITLDQLGGLLRYSYGTTRYHESKTFPGEKLYFRAAASAGGLYPLEIYPIVFNVDGLAPGIYHYGVVNHELACIRRGSVLNELLDVTTYHDLASTCSVMFAITAVFPRNLSKYLFRGYRFVCHDVGVLLQNFYLVGTGLGLATCAVGGFFDDEVGRLLDVDNVDENVMMLFSVGKLPG